MNWTIGTVIVCTLVVCGQIGSHFGRFGNALADELDKIKEHQRSLDEILRQLRKMNDKLSVIEEQLKDPEQKRREAAADAIAAELIAKAGDQYP
jgi:hypothetical protein